MPKKSQHNKRASKEQVFEWIVQYQENEDQEAQTNLVLNYQYLVDSIARKYSSNYSKLPDMQEVRVL